MEIGKPNKNKNIFPKGDVKVIISSPRQRIQTIDKEVNDLIAEKRNIINQVERLVEENYSAFANKVKQDLLKKGVKFVARTYQENLCLFPYKPKRLESSEWDHLPYSIWQGAEKIAKPDDTISLVILQKVFEFLEWEDEPVELEKWDITPEDKKDEHLETLVFTTKKYTDEEIEKLAKDGDIVVDNERRWILK